MHWNGIWIWRIFQIFNSMRFKKLIRSVHAKESKWKYTKTGNAHYYYLWSTFGIWMFGIIYSKYRIPDPIYHGITITISIVIVNFSTSLWPSAFDMNIHSFACVPKYTQFNICIQCLSPRIQSVLCTTNNEQRTQHTIIIIIVVVFIFAMKYKIAERKKKRLKPRGELVSWWVDCYFIRSVFFCHFNCLNVSNTYCRIAAVIATARSPNWTWIWLKIDFSFPGWK